MEYFCFLDQTFLDFFCGVFWSLWVVSGVPDGRPKSPKSMPKIGLDFGLIGGGVFGCTFGDFWSRKSILANPYGVFCGSIAFDSTIYTVWWLPRRVKIDCRPREKCGFYGTW